MRRISYRISMLKRMIVAAIALALFLMPVLMPDARAADSRWYVGLSVPVMFIDDTESVTTGNNIAFTPGGPMPTPYSANAVNEYKTGFRVSGALGYEFGSGFRVEGEVFFGRANVSKLTYTGITSGPLQIDKPFTDPTVSGPADQLGGMVNVWYDFNTGSRWKPFIGGGIGVMRSDWGDLKYDPDVPFNAALEAGTRAGLMANPQYQKLRPQAFEAVVAGAVAQQKQARQDAGLGVPNLAGTDTSFAYQVGAGLGYEVTDAITVQVGYRMFKANTFEFKGDRMTNVGPITAKSTTDMQVHLFEIGVRYRF